MVLLAYYSRNSGKKRDWRTCVHVARKLLLIDRINAISNHGRLSINMIDHVSLKRNPGSRKKYDEEIRAICPECGVGCGLVAYLDHGKIVDIQGDEDHYVSRGRLCARGLTIVRRLDSSARLQKTTYRRSRKYPSEEFDDWNTGLDILAERLKRIRDTYGPESLLIGCDEESGSDYYYPALHFANLWKTPYIFNSSDEPQRISQSIYPNLPGSSCKNSACILLVGSDLAATHPVAFSWILDAQKSGARIAVIDNRFTASMSKADYYFVTAPESENSAGITLLKMILQEHAGSNVPDADSARDRIGFLEQFETKSPERTTEAKIRELALLVARNEPVTVVTSKRLAGYPYYWIWELMAETMGWAGTMNGGWYPLDSGRPVDLTRNILQNDVHGFPSDIRPHSFDRNGAAGKLILEPNSPIKAAILSGSCLNQYFMGSEQALDNLELVAYFGSTQNNIHKLAHLSFPSTLWPERDNLIFTNDRDIYWSNKIVGPGPFLVSGLDFWTGLAKRVGFEKDFPWDKNEMKHHQEAFANWALSQSPTTDKINTDLMRYVSGKSCMVTWPYRGDSGAAQVIRSSADHENSFNSLKKSIEDLGEKQLPPNVSLPLYVHAPERPDPDGSQDLQFHALQVDLNPDIAAALDIHSGAPVWVQGARILIDATARIDGATPKWMVSCNQAIPENYVLVYGKDQLRDSALKIINETLSVE